MNATEFSKAVQDVAQKAVVKIITGGHWIEIPYDQRVKVPPSFIQQVWALVDLEKIKQQLATRIEKELADRVVNHMAAELSTDIKQILGNPERREEIRAVARKHLSHLMN